MSFLELSFIAQAAPYDCPAALPSRSEPCLPQPRPGGPVLRVLRRTARRPVRPDARRDAPAGRPGDHLLCP